MIQAPTGADSRSDHPLKGELRAHLEFAGRNLRLAHYIVGNFQGAEAEAKLYIALAWYGLACFYARSSGAKLPPQTDFAKAIPFEQICGSAASSNKGLTRKGWEDDLKRFYRESDNVPLTRLAEGDEEIKLMETHLRLIRRCLRQLRKQFIKTYGRPAPPAYYPRDLLMLSVLALTLVVGFGFGILQSPSPAASSAHVDAVSEFSSAPWRVSWFNNTKFQGEPVRVDQASNVDYEADASNPVPELTADNFSARFVTCLALPKQSLFQAELRSDDGSRLLINGEPVIDLWGEHAEWTNNYETMLPAGVHQVQIDYYETIGPARLSLKARINGSELQDLPHALLRLPDRSGRCS